MRAYPVVLLAIILTISTVAMAGEARRPRGGDRASATTEPWRPFSADSPWNTALAADAALDPLSRDYAEHLANSCPKWPFVTLNLSGYSIPVFMADAKTPSHLVTMLNGHENDRDEESRKPVPIPSDARPSVGWDAHLCIVDPQRMVSWEFYGVFTRDRQQFSDRPWAWKDPAWAVSNAYVVDLRGSGVRPMCGTVSPWQRSFGCRASGFPLIAGLIRAEELEAGEIRHALVLNYPRLRANWIVAPASAIQGIHESELMQVVESHGLPVGARIRFDPIADLQALGIPAAYRPILRALQTYGAFIGDASGAISLCLDESPKAQDTYQRLGVTSAGLAQILTAQVLAKHIQVLKLPDQWYYKNQGAKDRPDADLIAKRLAERIPPPAAKTKKPAAPRPIVQRNPPAKPVVTATSEALARWDARLRGRVQTALRAGAQPSLTLGALRQEGRVVELNDSGTLQILLGEARMEWSWQRLDPADRRSLSAGCDRALPTPDVALTAFWARLGGAIEEADELLLRADPTEAASVRRDAQLATSAR